MDFKELKICEPILRALREEGYESPTPIQEQAIPVLLSQKDLLGCAQTGTGKTAAFAIPILQLLREEKDALAAERKAKGGDVASEGSEAAESDMLDVPATRAPMAPPEDTPPRPLERRSEHDRDDRRGGRDSRNSRDGRGGRNDGFNRDDRSGSREDRSSSHGDRTDARGDQSGSHADRSDNRGDHAVRSNGDTRRVETRSGIGARAQAGQVPLRRESMPEPAAEATATVPLDPGVQTFNPSPLSFSARRRLKGKLPPVPEGAVPVLPVARAAVNETAAADLDMLDAEYGILSTEVRPARDAGDESFQGRSDRDDRRNGRSGQRNGRDEQRSSREDLPSPGSRDEDERGGNNKRRRKRGKSESATGVEAQAEPASERIIRALVLTPTRELALQVEESFETYGRHMGLRCTVVYGGVRQGNQVAALRQGVDILVATPGRLLDLVGQRLINLHHIRWLVLDEADRMLDMGFAPDVKRIIGMLPKIRQTMLFSATMPMEIMHLVETVLNEPEEVTVTPVASTVETIEQYVYHVNRINKRHLLVWLLQNKDIKNVLVFAKTKFGADRISRDLSSAGIANDAIHGDKAQSARQQALNDFKKGTIRVLVATDIAARGIDVDSLSHVINFDMPDVPESYVHRIGRTGRAGQTGTAFSFCDDEERPLLRDIRRLTKSEIVEVTDHPFALESVPETPQEKKIPFAGTRSKRRGHRPGMRSFG